MLTVAVGERQIKARNVILATGSRPNAFPGMEIDGEVVQHSWQTVVNRERPEQIVIVGGGIISCEMATVFRAYGSQVTILEALPHLLPGMEERISSLLERAFKRQGIEFQTGVRVESARREGDKARIVYGKDGQQQTHRGRPLPDRRGHQAQQRRPGPGRAGGAAGAGLHQGRRSGCRPTSPASTPSGTSWPTPTPWPTSPPPRASRRRTPSPGMPVRPLNYDNMPRPVFCHPQVAAIGLTERQAQERGYQVKIGEFPFSALGKAVAENEFEGVVRMVVDAKYGEILGCHIIGPEATELLAQVTPFKVLEGTSHEFEETVVSHPTLNEAVKHAALVAEGTALEI